MKRSAVFALLLFVACGSKPTAPEKEDWPAWCDPAAIELVGAWVRQFDGRGHRYRGHIRLEMQAPCVFDYTLTVSQLADEGHDEATMYVNTGQLVAVGRKHAGPLRIWTLEGMAHRSERRANDGTTTVDSTAQMLESVTAKLWGDRLSIWGQLYQQED